MNPQYLQYSQPMQLMQNYSYMQQPMQPAQTGSVGAVNIQIYNPTASPQGQMPQQVYPYNYNNAFQMPQGYYQTPPMTYQPMQQMPQPSQTLMQDRNASGTDPMQMKQAEDNVAAQSKTDDTKKNAEPKKNVTPLTDEYIKTLENYLNSQDNKIRLVGAKELLERFKEDETRKDDAALTALLNKMLQDPSETVKFVGLTTLDAGYATGNNETAQILSKMQTEASNYGEDAVLASRVLLKMSGRQAAAASPVTPAPASMAAVDQNGATTMQNNNQRLPDGTKDVLLKNN